MNLGASARTGRDSGRTSSLRHSETRKAGPAAAQESPASSPNGATRRKRCGRAKSAFDHWWRGRAEYAIFMLDPQGFVISWNAGAGRIKGYTAAEIIG